MNQQERDHVFHWLGRSSLAIKRLVFLFVLFKETNDVGQRLDLVIESRLINKVWNFCLLLLMGHQINKVWLFFLSILMIIVRPVHFHFENEENFQNEKLRESTD